ncbi:MAG TPA: hypothetical protein ENH75_03605 [archaeon]|nr:hypothetical protein [archaeon]
MDFNEISGVTALNNLLNLENFDLRNNPVSEIKGFENLQNLEYLYLGINTFKTNYLKKFGGLSSVGYALDPQAFVRGSKLKNT